MIVADANLIVALLASPPGVTVAKAVLAKDSTWWSSPFWRYEAHSALLKYLNASLLSVEDCEELMKRAGMLLGGRERASDSALVWRLAMKMKISSYDAEYVALAQQMGVRLVTFDQKLIRAAKGIAVSPGDFAK